MKLRFDLVFSYWIFLWFILYIFNFTSFSPKFALIIGLLENIIMGIMVFTYTISYTSILYFTILNFCIKVLPLLYLKNEKIYTKDIYFTLGLFLVFIVWLYINGQGLSGNLKIIYESLLYGKNNTPFMNFISQFK